MALRLVKNTGDDTTGDGTLGNPFLTIQRALGTGYVKGDTIGLLSAITISTKILLPANTSYVYTVICGVNDAGVEDGTRRTLHGGGTTDFAFSSSNLSADAHAFRISNIDFTGVNRILQTGGFFTRSIFSNFSLTGGQGVDAGGAGHSSVSYEDFELTALLGTASVFGPLGTGCSIKRGVIKNTNLAGFYFFQTTSILIENILITNCTTTGNATSFLYGNHNNVKNIIIDRCVVGGVASALFFDSSYDSVLITSITFTGTGTKGVFQAYESTLRLQNIRLWNIVGSTAIAFPRVATTGVLSRNVSVLTESPYVNDNGNDYTLKANYNGRRLAGVNLGSYNGLWVSGAI